MSKKTKPRSRSHRDVLDAINDRIPITYDDPESLITVLESLRGTINLIFIALTDAHLDVEIGVQNRESEYGDLGRHYPQLDLRVAHVLLNTREADMVSARDPLEESDEEVDEG